MIGKIPIQDIYIQDVGKSPTISQNDRDAILQYKYKIIGCLSSRSGRFIAPYKGECPSPVSRSCPAALHRYVRGARVHLKYKLNARLGAAFRTQRKVVPVQLSMSGQHPLFA